MGERRDGVPLRRMAGAALTACMALSLLGPPARAATGQIYGSFHADADLTLHRELLESVESAADAGTAVGRQLQGMTAAQRADPADVDQATAYAEAAIASAARGEVGEGPVHISAETVGALMERASAAREAVSGALSENGVVPHRKIARTVVFETERTDVTIVIHPDVLDTGVEKVRVACVGTPAFAVTIRPADLAADLRPESGPRTLTIRAAQTGTACEPGTTVPIPAVRVEVPDGQLSAPVTLSLEPGSAEPSTLRIRGVGGEASASRYEASSHTLDARIDASDIYTFGRETVSFPDLAERNDELRRAVEALARVDVVYGHSDGTFRPDDAVTRAEFIAFVMRALGRVNNALKSPFLDVTESSGCYHEIASAYYYGIVKGYDADHFRGELPISKTQIYAILGRILEGEMGYWPPEDPSGYLSGEFADEVAAWARSDIAIAVREGLLIRQEDGRFDGGRTVDRGDVALIIYGLYQRLA